MKNFFKKSYLLLGPLIFIWIIKDIDFIKLKDIISTIHPVSYALAAFLWLPATALKAYRWKKIMDIQKIYYSMKDAFLIYGSSSLLGLITPGKIGDFSKIAHLKKDNHSLGRAFLGSFLERIFDLSFAIVFVFAALFFLPATLHFPLNSYALAKLAGLVIFFLFGFLTLFYFLKKQIVLSLIREILEDLQKFKIKNISFIFILSALVWFFYFLLIYLIAVSISLQQSVNFLYLSFAAAIALLSGFLPITVIGIGTRETVFIFLLAPLGVAKETVITFSLLILVNYMALFALNFYCWIKKPLT
ncbi:MAG: flippase-like domain-containing protein [Candidatus Pacebacteria bacterium]|nr:flippase-like domain-containing protein [Candidatus Paceibacterota bacterium]NUQ57067.1 flippase-like domain-containing protein [Candidatus Paceibacter sp.]